MAAEIISPEILRDSELEQRLLEAVIADRNAQPRSQQLQIGPSEVGGCRELLRAGLFEPPEESEPETNWAAAAHVGQVMGADLERIFGERVNALLQQRYTTMFGAFGISISGGADLTFLDRDQISDLKSIEDMGSTLYDLKRDASAIETLLSIYREGLLFSKHIETADGGYELTQVILDKVAKLSNYIQIAIYVMGAMQAGIVSADGSGRLVFYDRSGNYQGFVAVVIPTEWIHMFYTIGQLRIGQVVQVQSAYEEVGQRAILATLRDKTPSFCFSTKVMCPRRIHCWGGSEYTPEEGITNQEHIDAANRYEVARDMAKLADGMKRTAKDALKADDVQGTLPDGRKLSWTRSGAINLVSTTVTEPQAQAVLDKYMPPVDLQAEIERERTYAATAALQVEQADAPVLAADTPSLGVDAPTLETATPELDPDEQQIIREQEAISEAVRPTPVLTREQRYKALAKTGAPVVRREAHALTGIELKGLRKEDAIDAILNHEYPKDGPVAEVADSPVRESATSPAESVQPTGEPTDSAETVVPHSAEEMALMDAAMQGGPEGDEAGDALHREQQRIVQENHQAGLAEDAAAWKADPRRLTPVDDEYPGDSGDDLAPQNGPEFATPEEPVNPGLGRVVFEPAYSEPEEPTEEEAAQADARRKLMHGPNYVEPEPPMRTAEEIRASHVPEVVHADEHEVLENEDPERPGLFFSGMTGRDRLRQMQYDNDPEMRERLISVRVKFNGNTPASQS